MKNMFITYCSFLVAIIIIRMTLSVAFSETAAEVFCTTATSFLFFYFICRLSGNKSITAK